MLTLLPITGIPIVRPGDRLADQVVDSLTAQDERFRPGDILVVAQKVVSKAEGRIVDLCRVTPSDAAYALADQCEKDPRLVELILQETRTVIRARPGLIVVEDVRGFVCANAGIDRSNVEQDAAGERVALLPLHPDKSAHEIRERIRCLTDVDVAVLINDSHGRAFREGTVGVTIGVAGMNPVSDRRGEVDLSGHALQHTVIGVADEIAGAASLIMGPAAEGVPAVLVRGWQYQPQVGSAVDLQRPRERDLFR